VNKPPGTTKTKLLRQSFDRTNMVLNWLNHNLAYANDMLLIAPPIQSRMYQELSNGMLGFNHALKVADVPFPFPYSQMLLLVLGAWTCFLPFCVMSFTQSLIAGPILAFILSTSMYCMNDLARELENPFGQDINDVCLPEFHNRFIMVVSDASYSSHHPPVPVRILRQEKERASRIPTDEDDWAVAFESDPEDKNELISGQESRTVQNDDSQSPDDGHQVKQADEDSNSLPLNGSGLECETDATAETQVTLQEMASLFSKTEGHFREMTKNLQRLSTPSQTNSTRKQSEKHGSTRTEIGSNSPQDDSASPALSRGPSPIHASI